MVSPAPESTKNSWSPPPRTSPHAAAVTPPQQKEPREPATAPGTEAPEPATDPAERPRAAATPEPAIDPTERPRAAATPGAEEGAEAPAADNGDPADASETISTEAPLKPGPEAAGAKTPLKPGPEAAGAFAGQDTMGCRARRANGSRTPDVPEETLRGTERRTCRGATPGPGS